MRPETQRITLDQFEIDLQNDLKNGFGNDLETDLETDLNDPVWP